MRVSNRKPRGPGAGSFRSSATRRAVLAELAPASSMPCDAAKSNMVCRLPANARSRPSGRGEGELRFKPRQRERAADSPGKTQPSLRFNRLGRATGSALPALRQVRIPSWGVRAYQGPTRRGTSCRRKHRFARRIERFAFGYSRCSGANGSARRANARVLSVIEGARVGSKHDRRVCAPYCLVRAFRALPL